MHTNQQQHLTICTLLPLTAAAGRSGGSLRKLKLGSSFVAVSAIADTHFASKQCVLFNQYSTLGLGNASTSAAASASEDNIEAGNLPITQDCQVTRASTPADSKAAGHHLSIAVGQLAAIRSRCPDSASLWYQTLRQFTGLQELIVDQYASNGGDLLKLNCEYLPSSLTVFHGRNLLLTSSTDNTTAGSSTRCGGDDQAAAHSCLQLHELNLVRCSINNPSILASGRLKKVTIIDSSLSSGWSAAATAWPHIQELVWKPEYILYVFDAHIREKLATERSRIVEALTVIAFRFPCLKSIIMYKLPAVPALSIDSLQYLVSHSLPLQKIKLYHWKHASNLLTAEVTNVAASISNDLQAAQNWLQQQLPWADVVLCLDD